MPRNKVWEVRVVRSYATENLDFDITAPTRREAEKKALVQAAKEGDMLFGPTPDAEYSVELM